MHDKRATPKQQRPSDDVHKDGPSESLTVKSAAHDATTTSHQRRPKPQEQHDQWRQAGKARAKRAEPTQQQPSDDAHMKELSETLTEKQKKSAARLLVFNTEMNTLCSH